MIEALLAGLFGLLIGSFLNVCIYRMPRDISVMSPARSFCPFCDKVIAWYDNIPILSYVLLGAKCRNCKTPIPIRYPMVELVTGLLFFWSVLSRGWTPLGLKMCIFSAIIVVLVITDFEARILPDEFTKGGAVVGLVLAAFVPAPSSVSILVLPSNVQPWVFSVVESLIGGLVSAGLLWGIGELYKRVRDREGLGFGDVKMMLVLGVFLGLPGTLLTVFIGSTLGAISGGLYIWLSKHDMMYELPFGSFLGASALIVGMFGEQILGWYLRMIG